MGEGGKVNLFVCVFVCCLGVMMVVVVKLVMFYFFLLLSLALFIILPSWSCNSSFFVIFSFFSLSIFIFLNYHTLYCFFFLYNNLLIFLFLFSWLVPHPLYISFFLVHVLILKFSYCIHFLEPLHSFIYVSFFLCIYNYRPSLFSSLGCLEMSCDLWLD